jgi:branched-chain amino acid transport system permease protein
MAETTSTGSLDPAAAGEALVPFRILTRGQLLGASGLFGVMVLAAFYAPNNYLRHLLVTGSVFAILVMSQNLIIGYMGLLNLAHAAFWGLGAYGSALLVMRGGASIYVGYLFGMLLAASAGAVVGVMSIRFGGHYLAIVSLGFGIIVYQLINNLVELTRGPFGLTGIPAPTPIGPIEWTPTTHVISLGLVMTLVLLFLFALRRSKLGVHMDAVRLDLVAAKSLGINTTAVKVTGYTIAAGLAGLAGGMYAHYRRIIAPEAFVFGESGIIMAMAVLGGLRSYPGSIAAGFFFIMVPELLRGLAQWRLVLYGSLLIVVVLYYPRGLAGLGIAARKLSLRALGRGPKSN